MRRHPVLIGILVAGAVAACDQPSAPTVEPVREIEDVSIRDLEVEAREHGWDEQARMLADGSVSEAEYLQAVDEVRACAERDGNGISEPVLSPIDNLTLEFGFPQGALSDDEVWSMSDRCLQQWFWTVHTGYLVSHDARMDTDLLEASVECMAEQGFTLAGDLRNARDLAVRVPREGEAALADCIADAVARLRPDLDGVGISW